MITYEHGRWRSQLTPVEQRCAAIDSVSRLTAEERAGLELVLDEYETTGESTTANEVTEFEWDEVPLPIDEWLKSEFHVGETGKDLYPVLREDMCELFHAGALRKNGYAEAVFTGAIGWGKDYLATFCTMRVLYELLCLKNPQHTLGLGAGEPIHIVPISRTVAQAKRVVFGGLCKKLNLAPWFRGKFIETMEEVRFKKKGIYIVGGASQDASALGLNVICALVDECLVGETEVIVARESGDCEVSLETLYRESDYGVRPIAVLSYVCGELIEAEARIKLASFAEVYTVRLGNGAAVTGTENHPFLVRREDGDEDYVFLRDLRPGDQVVTVRGYERADGDDRVEARDVLPGAERRVVASSDRAGQAGPTVAAETGDGLPDRDREAAAGRGQQRQLAGCRGRGRCAQDQEEAGNREARDRRQEQGQADVGRPAREVVRDRQSARGRRQPVLRQDAYRRDQSQALSCSKGQDWLAPFGGDQGEDRCGATRSTAQEGYEGYAREDVQVARGVLPEARARIPGVPDRIEVPRRHRWLSRSSGGGSSSGDPGRRCDRVPGLRVVDDSIPERGRCTEALRAGLRDHHRWLVGGCGGHRLRKGVAQAAARGCVAVLLRDERREAVDVEQEVPGASVRGAWDSEHRERPGCVAHPVVVATVESIEPAGRAQTYDLCVPTAENFIANGVVVHNSNFMGEGKVTTGSASSENYDKATMIYNALARRVKSRFQRHGVSGMVFLISSKRATSDFTERHLRQAMKDDDPTVFVRDYCLTGDTRVPLLDGTTWTMRELAEQKTDGCFWTYSVDPVTRRFVPGRAHSPRLTARNERVLEVELDSGDVVRATPRHPFMLRDGSYRRADELAPGDSLMPLYRQTNRFGYEELSQPSDGKWETTHKMSAVATRLPWPKRGSDGKAAVLHHVDFDKRNNVPENLNVMEWDAHQRLHSEAMQPLLDYVRSDKHRRWASERMRKLHQDPEFARRARERGRKTMAKLREDPAWCEKTARATSKSLTKFHKTEAGKRAQKKRSRDYWKKHRKTSIVCIRDGARAGKTIYQVAKELGVGAPAISVALRRAGEPTFSELKRAAGHFSRGGVGRRKGPGNHKVVAVRDGGRADVYDLTVDDYHNFSLEAGIVVHNSVWNVNPEPFVGQKWHRVMVSPKTGRSRVLGEDEEVEEDDETLVLRYPDDYHQEFVNDTDGSVRDFGGIATDFAGRLFIGNRLAIDEMCDAGRPQWFRTQEWRTDRLLRINWAAFMDRDARDDPICICCPKSLRHVHIDLSQNHCATGFCMGHICGAVQVKRRDPDTGDERNENAPMIHIDCVLRIVAPDGGDVDHSEVRGLVYRLQSKGVPIRSVSMDQYMAPSNLQIFKKRGLRVLEIGERRFKMKPYIATRQAIYEQRMVCPSVDLLVAELKGLEISDDGRKVTKPQRGCFAGGTRVRLFAGRSLTFAELVEEFGNGREFYVYTVRNGKVGVGVAKNPRVTKRDAELVEVELDDGATVCCTPDHRFMLWDGSYREAGQLAPGDSLMPLYTRISKVVSVASAGRGDVYDLTVDETHNFALGIGVFVHNSKDLADALSGVVYYMNENMRAGAALAPSLGTSVGSQGAGPQWRDGEVVWEDEVAPSLAKNAQQNSDEDGAGEGYSLWIISG